MVEMRALLQALVVAAVALAGIPALAQQDVREFPLSAQQTRVGLVWATPEGMTLYIHLRDEPQSSSCTGTCADRWPPHEAAARHRQFPPQGFSVITRPDGQLQWAYKNMPLYTRVTDREPGDITGHGHLDDWWVAIPDEEHLDLEPRR